MSLIYIPQTLVHAHLPCPPTVPDTIPELRIPTDRDATDYDTEEILLQEHALSFCYSAELNVIARATHNGHTLELRPLDLVYNPAAANKDINSSDIIRIVFPERISRLSEGCIVVSELDRRVYILVYTDSNVLYRLNFPLAGNKMGRGSRFGFTIRGNEDWVEEWEIPQDAIAAAGGVGVWTVLDELNVVLGCGDGGIIRLTRSSRLINGSWSAHHHRVSSRFRLPSLFSSAASDEQVLAFATHTIDDEHVFLYAISRDRKLRIWNGLNGNLLKTLDVKAASQDLVLRGSHSSDGTSTAALLDTTYVPLIRIVPHPNESSQISHLLVVFASTPNDTSVGTFLVYRVSRNSNDVSLAGEKRCSTDSAGSELRGFDILYPTRFEEVSSGWRLCVVWNRKGETAYESVAMDDIFQFTTIFNQDSIAGSSQGWQSASVNNDPLEFDPAYFDDMLSLEPPDVTAPKENGDISQTFVDHLFYPGRFSILSLTTALEEYLDQLPRNKAYAEIGQSFPSLAKKFERIVGCTLQMELNAQTGAPEVGEYRAKLKTQWLGIWARVRNLDAGARWPLGTALLEEQLVVVTREGFTVPVALDTGAAVDEMGQLSGATETFIDLPRSALGFHTLLADRTARSDTASVSAAGRFISKLLSNVNHEEQNGTVLEVFTEDLNAHVAKPYSVGASLKADEIHAAYLAYLTDDEQDATRRLLSESSTVPAAILKVLDILASVDPPSANSLENLRFSGIGNALIAATIGSRIRSRCNLARNAVLVASFYCAEMELGSVAEEEFTHILYRAFTTYQRYRTLLFISEQAADEALARRGTKTGKRRNGDDVEGGLSDGQEGFDVDQYETSYSLLHSLLAQRLSQSVPVSLLGELYETSNAVLLSLLSLDATAWDNVPQQRDVRLAFDVLEDGHPTIAGTITTFYPESAGMYYVRARAYLDIGDIWEAEIHFEKAAAGRQDQALEAILPVSIDAKGLAQYYRHVTKLFEDRGVEEPIIRFGNLALEATTAGDPAVKDIWTKVFLASLSIGTYDKAYVTLTTTPHIDLRRDFLGQLISTMCEANRVGELLRFGFVGFQKDVENMLQFKARHSDPLRPPHYHQVLYSWHVTRGDYRSAADVMYQQAKRLEGSSRSKEFSPYDVGIRQASSYLAAINALSLLDKRQAWLANPLLPSVAAKGEPGAKRRRVTSYVPEDDFGAENGMLEVITLADVRAEYASVLARLQLATVLPGFFDISGVPLEAEELVGLFVQRGMFDEAQASASGAQVDLSDFFTVLARRCVQFTQPGADNDIQTPSAAWLYRSAVTAHLQGPPSALAMRYLQTALARHDSEKTNWKYRWIVSEVLLSENKDMHSGWKMPGWLVEWEMERDPESWISRTLKWGWVIEAVEMATVLLKRQTPPELLPRTAGASDTAWNLLDRVITASKEGVERNDPSLQEKVKALEIEMQRRTDGLQRVTLAR